MISSFFIFLQCYFEDFLRSPCLFFWFFRETYWSKEIWKLKIISNQWKMPKTITWNLKRQLKLGAPQQFAPRWFSYKNNHVFKSKEFNQLMFLALSLNSWLQQTYFFMRYHKSKRKEGNHEYLSHFFDTLAFVPTMKAELTTKCTTYCICSKRWWNNLCRTKVAICNTWLLYPQSYYTLWINTDY